MREILSQSSEFLNRVGESFWDFAGIMFIQVTVLVLVLLVLELLLRNRVRAVVRYAVWLLVLVKLVLPVGLHTPASVAYWLPAGRAVVFAPSDHRRRNDSASLEMVPAAPTVDHPEQFDPGPPRAAAAADESLHSAGAQLNSAPSLPASAAVVSSPPTRLHWQGALFGTWLLTVGLLLALVARRAFWVRRIVRQATDAPHDLHEQLRESLAVLGMTKRRVDLKISNRLGSPAICGFSRPTILLPRGFPAGLDREQIRLVFVHEMTHWRRGDLQVNCFQTLLQILYFYNPAVWIANLMIRRLREQAVDETVLVALRGQPERYAATLLDIASAALQPAEAMLRLIGVVESRRALSTRIRHILHRPIPRSAKLGLTGLTAIVASGLLLLPMGQRERSAAADNGAARKPRVTSDNRDSDSNDARELESTGAAKGLDIDGDPLPAGVIARLGTKRFRTSREGPVALAYLADGKTLAQVTSDTSHGWLQHWDPLTGRLLDEKRLSDHHVFFVRSAAHAGNQVAVYGSIAEENQHESVESIGLFNLLSGARTLEMRIQDRRSEHVALSPDGRFIAYNGILSGPVQKLHLIDVAGQAEIASINVGDRVESLAISPDGKIIGVGLYTGRALLWSWSDKAEPRSIDLPQSGGTYPVGALAFSPDGATVAVVNGNRDFKCVPLIDAASGRIVRTFSVPEFEHHNSRALAFSPDGTLLAATINEMSGGGGVALWDVSTGKLVRHLSGIFSEPYFLAFSPNGRQLAASDQWYSTMSVWNLDTGRPVKAEFAGHFVPPNAIHFLPGDQQVATAGDDGTIRIWNIADSRKARVLQHEPDEHTFSVAIKGMDVSPDGKYLVSSSMDDTVRMWEISTGRQIYRLPGNGSVGGKRAVQFTPDSKQFASWGDDMRVCLWDVATGKAVRESIARPSGLKTDSDELGNPPFSAPGLGPRLHDARFSNDASSLVMALNGARKFSVQTGVELSKFDYQPGTLTLMAMSPDNRLLLLAIWGGVRETPLKDEKIGRINRKSQLIELRSLADGKTITQTEVLGSGLGRPAFSPNGELVAIPVIDEPPRIELRKVSDLSAVGRIDLPTIASRARVVEFSHSGKLLAVPTADSNVLVWDLDHLPQKASP